MQEHWSIRAIARAGEVTRAYEVMKAWLAVLAAFVLFGCLIMNIIQIVAPLSDTVIGVVIIIEAIALDVAGLGLLSIAKHAQEQGQEKEAGHARITAWALILIMIATVGTVTAAKLWPGTVDIMHQVDNVLILVRVCMIIVYGVVLNELYQAHVPLMPTQQQQDQLAEIARSIATLQAQTAQSIGTIQQQIARLETAQISAPAAQSLDQDELRQFIQLSLQESMRTISISLEKRIETVTAHVAQSVHTAQLSVVSAQSGAQNAPRVTVVEDQDKTTGAQPPEEISEKGRAIISYVHAQIAQGQTPTNEDIMSAMNCAKNTASKYRRLALEIMPA